MLSKDMFSLSEHVFIFRHFSPNDIKYLAAYIGNEAAGSVRELADYEYLHYSGNVIHRCPPLEL